MNRYRPVGGASATRSLPPRLTRNQLRFHRRMETLQSGKQFDWPIILLALAGLAYNGALALLYAHGFPVSRPMVVAAELLILAGGGVVVLASGSHRTDAGPALLFVFFLSIAMIIYAVNGDLVIEMARNAAIIALFLMLGSRIGSEGLRKGFLIAGLLVGAGLLLEVISTETYASVFQPGPYFQQTRGIGVADYDDSGLFAPALGFEGRFSILSITGHRTASIFLEQVSLGNFAAVMSIFLACKWAEISKGQRIFSIALIVLILVTTNSRSGLALSLAAPVAYRFAPRLHRYFPLLLLPAVLVATLLIARFFPSTGDDLPGRLGVTVENLSTLDLTSLAGLEAVDATHFLDSGYTYVIYASSLLGLLALWLFVGTVAAGRSKEMLRCALLLGLYIFANLSVSGTSIFSIKTAAMLWLLVGHMRREAIAAGEEKAAEREPKGSPATTIRARRRFA